MRDSTGPFDPTHELDAFRRFGDRTSSLATLGSQFESRRPLSLADSAASATAGEADLVRVLELPGALVAASEPLAPASRRADVLAALAASAPGRRCLAMPVGRTLAHELRSQGFSAWQVGSEPVFHLDEYFAPGQDPYARHRVAMALGKRGAEVRELDLKGLSQGEAAAVRAEMDEVAALWLADKACLPLGFLARVEPFAQQENKRYFLLRVRGQLQGFVAAAPFCREGNVLGYYFQDMPRRPDARSGAGELLLLESLRLLAQEGVAEARLGMAPLAQLDPKGPGAGLLGLLYRRWTWGYNFRSVAEFKGKFAPTSWEPLYLVSTCPRLGTALADALRAHFPDGLLRPFIHLMAGSGLTLRPEAAPVLAAAGRTDPAHPGRAAAPHLAYLRPGGAVCGAARGAAGLAAAGRAVPHLGLCAGQCDLAGRAAWPAVPQPLVPPDGRPALLPAFRGGHRGAAGPQGLCAAFGGRAVAVQSAHPGRVLGAAFVVGPAGLDSHPG